jgi:hypothetical protein
MGYLGGDLEAVQEMIVGAVFTRLGRLQIPTAHILDG